jgi:glycosyltransferase involved in cell wall biosynthesis
MSIILSHPTGNTNVRAIADGLLQANLLFEFNTSIAAFPNNFWSIIGQFKALSDFRRRSFNRELQPYTKLNPYGELGRALSNKLGLDSFVKHETGIFCVDKNYQNFDKGVSKRLSIAKRKGVTAVYAYEDGALETFIEAKRIGLHCIYDLPIAYHETLQNVLREEAQARPDWAKTLGGGVNDSPLKLARKKKELELADTIIVASDFVRNSLPKWALDKKIIQSPFGTPTNNSIVRSKKIENKKLRILFVGSMTQRKGLADLFDAMQFVDNDKVELVVLGSLSDSMTFYKEYAAFTYEKTRAHKEVLELMQTCDVFCLPSIVEGRALVMQEAMSQGLPLIITPNTGGEDLIVEGETGFLVPIRSPKIIAEKINWFIENRAKVNTMGLLAQKHASGYSWKSYSTNIINELAAFI